MPASRDGADDSTLAIELVRASEKLSFPMAPQANALPTVRVPADGFCAGEVGKGENG